MAKYGRVNDRSKNLRTCAHIYVVLLTTVHSSCIVSKVDLDQQGINQLVINQSINQSVRESVHYIQREVEPRVDINN